MVLMNLFYFCASWSCRFHRAEGPFGGFPSHPPAQVRELSRGDGTPLPLWGWSFHHLLPQPSLTLLASHGRALIKWTPPPASGSPSCFAVPCAPTTCLFSLLSRLTEDSWSPPSMETGVGDPPSRGSPPLPPQG